MVKSRFTFQHSVRVVCAIGWSDFLLKYRGSILGYLWSLIGPVVKFLVMLFAIGPYVSSTIPHYPLYLFLGLIIWEHFSNTTTNCMTMLFDKEVLITRMRFPRILLVLMVGWTNLVVFLTYLLIFLVSCFFAGIFPSWQQFLYLPLILLQMSLVALGVGMVLSAYSLKYRDVQHLWLVLLQMLFWLTPIFYPYKADRPLAAAFLQTVAHPNWSSYTNLFSDFVLLQPLSILINDARRASLFPEALAVPSLAHAVGFTLVCGIIFFIGMRTFEKRSRYFVQEY